MVKSPKSMNRLVRSPSDTGPMKKFDMDDGMTMVFRAADPAMLKAVKAGDKVKFDADKVNGQFTLTKLQKVK